MSHLTTSEVLPNATFSPELASGPIPSASQDGLTINQSGLVPARASLSARQAKAMGLLTSGTFGPTSSTSSASADLSMSLANRLQAVTQTHGSTLYKLTWKEWDTPSGLCRLRQRASVLRTSENELIGWLSPLASNIKNCYQDWKKVMARKEAGRQPNLQDFAVLAAWPTPVANTNPQPETKRGLQHVAGAARLTGWPTPQVNYITNATTVQMSGDGRETPNKIGWAASLCGPLRLTVFGEIRTGSHVEMANGVQLNPAHSRWLSGAAARLGRVEPGVARVASSNRVGRLKGYGNAINAQAAAEFIRAYMGVSYGR
ncbi:Methyltransferase [Citrobacter portucalensis]|nr:Methyltransferase [Citrobacter portucalensis]